MKIKLLVSMIILTLTISLTSCGKEMQEDVSLTESGDVTSTENDEEIELRVGILTDVGVINDNSYNQGIWEGVKLYEKVNSNIDIHYIQPIRDTTSEYLRGIDDLVALGYELIIVPGSKFTEAVSIAQEKYPDIYFALIDGELEEISDNTVEIIFAENEAGFYAGVVSALLSQTGKVAFIGGEEIIAVQKYGWGFISGVAYANEVLGTDVEITDYTYTGSFVDEDKNHEVANNIYNKGADIIFVCSGSGGIGAIEEAKSRQLNNEKKWIVGADIDQYEEGIYKEGKSVVITSAVKSIGVAVYDSIDSVIKNNFLGGERVVLDTTKNAVGLSQSTQNVPDNVKKAYIEIYKKVKNKEIIVPSTKEELDLFLVQYNFEMPEYISY